MSSKVDPDAFPGKVVGVLTGSGRLDFGEIASPRFRLLAAALLLVGLLLLVAATWIIWVVDRSLQELTRDSLTANLAANTAALESWWIEQCRQAQSRLENESVAAAARDLIQQHVRDPAWSAAALRTSGDYESLKRIAEDPGDGWVLLDLQRIVVAASDPTWAGQSLPIPEEAMLRLVERKAVVTRPLKLPLVIQDRSAPDSIPGGALMFAMAPVIDDWRTVGSLSTLIDPADRFARLFSVARAGRTGESYAFDRRGVLLSESRFESQLRTAGLLDADPRISSLLNIEIRDPGSDLSRGGRPALDLRQQPLTWMADHATRGATGENVTGYNNYRGVAVVGAWRWLPEFGIGIATEMEIAEAYRPVHLLRRALYGLLGLAFLGGGGWLLVGFALSRRRRRSGASGTRKLGQYELGELIGRGGMGSVYRGRHPLLHREVAVKVLEFDSESNQLTIARFEREVQLTAQLRHPNTISIYDYGRTPDDTFFYVMEYVEGINLQELVDQYGRQQPARVIHLLLQICGSLSEAHQLGMIHRDIKPSNLLLTTRSGLHDMIKVLDFGLVKQVDRESPGSCSTDELTQADGITGTPMYMSPESVRDASTADQRSDLYSLGAVGYTLLTGKPLFDGESSVDVCLQQLNDQPPRPSDRINQPLPEDLQNVLMSCLRKSPDERPMSAEDLADSLRHCQDANRWTMAEAIQWWEAEAN